MSSPTRTGRVATYGAGQLSPLSLRLWLISGLGLLVIVGAFALTRGVAPLAEATENDPPRIIHIHRSDVRGTDSTGALKIRCRFCAGGGKVWHWADVRQQGHIIHSYKDRIITCPGCGGSGVISTRDLQDPVHIVPDSQPADYNEKRLVR